MRHYMDFAFNGPVEAAFNEIIQCMTVEGFEYTTYGGEQLFKKGHGVVKAPSFVKVSFIPGYARVEAWIKFAALPGVYAGEYGFEGTMGFAVKDTIKNTSRAIANILAKYGGTCIADAEIGVPYPLGTLPAAPAQPVAQIPVAPAQPVAQIPAAPAQPQSATRFCPRCGTPCSGGSFCVKCGNKLY